jgi:hypothetical protein
MSQTNSFVQELVRAANEIAKVTDQERQRLLERAALTIRDLRDEIQRWPSPNVVDAVEGLEQAAASLREGSASDEQSQAALLDAAEMIRDLLAVRHTGTEPKD